MYKKDMHVYIYRDLSPEDPAKGAVALTANVCDDLVHAPAVQILVG